MNTELREMNFELREMNSELHEVNFGLREINLTCEVLDSQGHRKMVTFWSARSPTFILSVETISIPSAATILK